MQRERSREGHGSGEDNGKYVCTRVGILVRHWKASRNDGGEGEWGEAQGKKQDQENTKGQ